MIWRSAIVRPLADVLRVSRAYSIPYTVLCGLTAMLLAPTPLPLRAVAIGCVVPALLAVGLAALNDYTHRQADIAAQRGRSYPPWFLLALGVGGTGAALLLAAWGGTGLVWGLAGCIVAGLAYGLLKKYPGAGNLLRGVTSIPLILGLGSLAGSDLGAMLPLAGGIALLDAAGNLYGDVRDAERDRQSGTRTLAVVAPGSAIPVAVSLHLLAVVLWSLAGWLLWPTLAGIAWVITRQQHWQHRAFLMLKYATVGVLALTLARSPGEYALSMAVALGGGAAAWAIYTSIHQERGEERHYAASH